LELVGTTVVIGHTRNCTSYSYILYSPGYTDRIVRPDLHVLNVEHVTINQLDPTPLWQQLAAIIRERIKAGQYKPRDPVPSESQLQQEHGVARGTVRRAMRALSEEGWTVTVQGRGTFVVPKESWPTA
jgi:hypothetical protein